LVRSYTLNYGSVPNVIGVSKATGRAQLTRITECAADNCFKPTSLTWLDTPTGAPNVVEGAINWPAGMPVANPTDGQSYSAQKPDDIRPFGDLDGDGVVEIMRSVRTSATTARHFVVAFNADRSPRSCFDLDLMLSQSQGLLADTDALTAADFNNDGRADILVSNRIFFADKVLPATSQCVAPPAGTFKEFSLASISNACILTDGLTQFPFGAVRTLMPTDLNGDGLTDLALYTTGTFSASGSNSCPAGNGYGLYYWINTTPAAPIAGQMNASLSFGASNKLALQAFTNTGGTAGYEQIVSLSDLNGDAVPELLTSVPAAANYDEYIYKRYNSATLSATAFTFAPATTIAQGAALNLLDVNGDGLSDLLYASTNAAACTSAWQLHENRGARLCKCLCLPVHPLNFPRVFGWIGWAPMAPATVVLAAIGVPKPSLWHRPISMPMAVAS